MTAIIKYNSYSNDHLEYIFKINNLISSNISFTKENTKETDLKGRMWCKMISLDKAAFSYVTGLQELITGKVV